MRGPPLTPAPVRRGGTGPRGRARLDFLARALAVLVGVAVAARGYAEDWGPLASAAAGLAAFAAIALAMRAVLRRSARWAQENEPTDGPPLPPLPPRRARRRSGRRLLTDDPEPGTRDPDT